MRVERTILDHWHVALENARANLNHVTVINAAIQDVAPREIMPGGYVDLLIASPECVMFSSARGAKPINDQRRSTCAEVLRFLEDLEVQVLILENVQELEDWGPLHPETLRPIPSRKDEYFRAFVKEAHSVRKPPIFAYPYMCS